MPGPKIPCPKKLSLLQEYVRSVQVHNQDVREYSELIQTMSDGDLITVVKKRMAESKNGVRDARKRYTDHVQEHGCEFQTNKRK